jgi:DNA-nicking Smr family endonuclease
MRPPRKQNRRIAATPSPEFRAEVADAVPIINDRVVHEMEPAPAWPRQTQLEKLAVLDDALHGGDLVDMQLEGGDQAAWSRTGVQRSVLRDLRRGRWVVEEKLDLHGLSRTEARQAVREFLGSCMAKGLRCVRIVHGKGLSSPGREPVLKTFVPGWLSQNRDVLAFCQARAAEGGAGAMVVLLTSPGAMR